MNTVYDTTNPGKFAKIQKLFEIFAFFIEGC